MGRGKVLVRVRKGIFFGYPGSLAVQIAQFGVASRRWVALRSPILLIVHNSTISGLHEAEREGRRDALCLFCNG